MDFFTNAFNKVKNAIGSLFAPKQEETIPGLRYESGPPLSAGMTFTPQSININDLYSGTDLPRPMSYYDLDFGDLGYGGYGTTAMEDPNTTNFGMPNELVGALRDVGGYTWQHQGNDVWTRLRPTDTGGGIDDIVNSFVDPIAEALNQWKSRLDEYYQNNPFAFDEAQARAASEELINPYYDAELNEYLTGVRRTIARSVEDTQRTIGELNVDASKLSERERFATQEAIRSSEEGYAGAGLFFSGARERATGVEEVQGIQKQEDIQTALGRDVSSTIRSRQRLEEDKALEEARQRRLIGASRTTALETDIAQRKKEAEYQRGLEALQFAGDLPGLNALDKMKLENEFLSKFA